MHAHITSGSVCQRASGVVSDGRRRGYRSKALTADRDGYDSDRSRGMVLIEFSILGVGSGTED